MRKIQINEKGLSLIEVVASVVLIGFILTSFFTLFIQSKKVGVASEEIVDAVFIAQQSMEEIYSLTQTRSLHNTVNYLLHESDKTILETNYHQHTNYANFYITYNSTLADSIINIQFKKKMAASIPSNINLYNVLITVTEKDIAKTKMENILSINY